MKENRAFIMYPEAIRVVEHLSNKQAGKLFKLVLSYANGIEVVEQEDMMIRIAFNTIRSVMDSYWNRVDILNHEMEFYGKQK